MMLVCQWVINCRSLSVIYGNGNRGSQKLQEVAVNIYVRGGNRRTRGELAMFGKTRVGFWRGLDWGPQSGYTVSPKVDHMPKQHDNKAESAVPAIGVIRPYNPVRPYVTKQAPEVELFGGIRSYFRVFLVPTSSESTTVYQLNFRYEL